MAELAAWANEPPRLYRQEAVDEFMASADLKLIAHAIVSGATVVTREQPAPDSRRKIKIDPRRLQRVPSVLDRPV
jgi:predicted nicotinamide N-methyase